MTAGSVILDAPRTATRQQPGAPRRGARAVPCLYSDNSIGQSVVIEGFRVQKYHAKVAFSIQCNVKELARLYGIKRLGFLTLTFADHLDWREVDDWKEGQRRFNSFATNVLRELFTEYMTILEPQGSGRIHFHLLVVCREDIRTGFDFDGLVKRDYSSASKYLRGLWGELRRKCKHYSFGRSELLPIKTNEEAVGHYVGSYLGKSMVSFMRCGDRASFRGRRVRYSQGWKCAGVRFSWNSKSNHKWRMALAHTAEQIGFKSLSDFRRAYGPRWAYYLGESILRAYAAD